MTTIPAVNAPKDLGKARLAIVVGNQVMSIPAAGMYQPLDADLTALSGIGAAVAGDLIYSPADGTWVRLAKGSALQNLRMNAAGTAPEWAAAREVLTANRTYYVRTDGNDSNNGLSNTAGGAFLTIQRAYDVVAATLDLAGFTVTIQIADGTYAPSSGSSSIVITTGWTGGGTVVLQGNSATPSNVVISVTNAQAIWVRSALPGVLRLKDFKVQTTISGDCIRHSAPGVIEFSGLNFGSCAAYHIKTDASGATIKGIGAYSISGGAVAHSVATLASAQIISGFTVTLLGTPAFSGIFVLASTAGQADWSNIVFSGSATGGRYTAILNGAIYTGAAGANYFPGSIAGTTSTGGQYL